MASVSLYQLESIKLKQLKTFKSVVDCGGFTSAEKVLKISRPTISNHIAELESHLNVVLCKRGRGGFSLTEEGRVLYDQTCQLLINLDQFCNALNNI